MQSKCNHNTGFPSDHFLLQFKIRVKLGSRPPVIPRAPKLNYSSAARKREMFQESVRAAYATHTQHNTIKGTREHTVYTDGSGSRGRATSSSPAGWGVHIHQGHSVIEGYGIVNTDRTSAYFLGATVGSTNTAELTTIIEAMLFLLHDSSKTAKAITYYDSKWAAQMTRGQARPKRNKDLVNAARKIHAKLTSSTEVTWEWIKGHTGNEGNERADELAELGKSCSESQGLRYQQRPPLLYKMFLCPHKQTTTRKTNTSVSSRQCAQQRPRTSSQSSTARGSPGYQTKHVPSYNRPNTSKLTTTQTTTRITSRSRNAHETKKGNGCATSLVQMAR